MSMQILAENMKIKNEKLARKLPLIYQLMTRIEKHRNALAKNVSDA